MNGIGVEELLERERAVWQALVDGDPQADEDLLTEDFLGVHPSGFADRADHVGQLADGPTVASYELSEARVIEVSPTAALLSYRAEYRRPTGEAVEVMYISSLWCQRNGRWVNVFSQDTPAG